MIYARSSYNWAADAGRHPEGLLQGARPTRLRSVNSRVADPGVGYRFLKGGQIRIQSEHQYMIEHIE